MQILKYKKSKQNFYQAVYKNRRIQFFWVLTLFSGDEAASQIQKQNSDLYPFEASQSPAPSIRNIFLL